MVAIWLTAPRCKSLYRTEISTWVALHVYVVQQQDASERWSWSCLEKNERFLTQPEEKMFKTKFQFWAVLGIIFNRNICCLSGIARMRMCVCVIYVCVYVCVIYVCVWVWCVCGCVCVDEQNNNIFKILIKNMDQCNERWANDMPA